MISPVPAGRPSLLTFAGAAPATAAGHGGAARFAFWLDDPAGLGDDGRSFTLTPGEAALINPNTGALPAFRSARDAALTAAIYRRVPALWDQTRADGNPWKMRLATAFPRAGPGQGRRQPARRKADPGRLRPDDRSRRRWRRVRDPDLPASGPRAPAAALLTAGHMRPP
jgi:hypothetical protein